MTIYDQTSNDLESSRLVLHKLAETISDFQTRSISIASLCEQWRTLQGSFANIHNSLENRVKEVEAKEREVRELQKSFELEKIFVGNRCKAVEVGAKRNAEEELDAKEKKIEERFQVLEVKEKRLLEDAKAMEFERKQMDERFRQMELKEMEIQDRFLALQMKEKQFCIHLHENELVVVRDVLEKGIKSKEYVVKHHGSSSSLTNERQELHDSDIHQVARSEDCVLSSANQIRSFCKRMNALYLGLFLSDKVKEKSTSPEEILDALKYAPDPGKLVLEITRTFHQNVSDKDMTTNFKDSCILLLEQLMKLSPPITHDVREEARHLAITLKAGGKGTPTDNFGFLQFVAAFKLAEYFDANDLLSMFGSFYRHGVKIYRHHQLGCLCSALGLLDKIPGLIRSYIQRNKLITAVKCICDFKLQHVFPPVPLLQNYLDLSNAKVNAKRKDGTSIPEIEMLLSVLQDVTSCIATFKLESKFPPGPLLLRIVELSKEKEERKVAARSRRHRKKKRSASSCDFVEDSLKQLQKCPRMEDNHCNK